MQRLTARFSEYSRRLKKVGMTLQILWEEYSSEDPAPYSYSRFCEVFQKYRKVGGCAGFVMTCPENLTGLATVRISIHKENCNFLSKFTHNDYQNSSIKITFRSHTLQAVISIFYLAADKETSYFPIPSLLKTIFDSILYSTQISF